MDPEQRQALYVLSAAPDQFLAIKVVVGPDLAPRVTIRGFLQFRAEGKRKKDLAYAALCAILSLLRDPDFHDDADADPGQCMAM